MDINETTAAVYNVKAVIRETGLAPDTLRTWERRYGVPRPERSLGRQRRYSQRDVDQLKWLIARQREGMAISRAVELWNGLEASGQDPLRTTTALAAPVADSHTPLELQHAWIEACQAYDERRAEAVLAQAFALYPPERVCLDVIQQGVATLGDRWYRAQATVHQEHLASELATRQIERLIAATPPAWRSGRLVVGCPPGEDHRFPPLLLTALLRRRGWDTLYLGSDVPVEHFDRLAERVQPSLVLLSAQRLPTAATLRLAASTFECLGIPLAFGGGIFNRIPSLRARVPGFFVGETLIDAIATVERVVTEQPAASPVSETPPDFLRERTLFLAQQGEIEIEIALRRRLVGFPGSESIVALATNSLAQYVAAALLFGDLSLLAPEIAWTAGLLAAHQMDGAQLATYLSDYAAALSDVLGDACPRLSAWFAPYRTKPT